MLGAGCQPVLRFGISLFLWIRTVRVDTPLDRARVKCEQLERELKRSPDFQLYLLAESPRDRARMESLLMEIPQFALWHILTGSIERARRESVLKGSAAGASGLTPF